MKVTTLAQAQQREQHCLSVLHFESRKVVEARRALQEAEAREAKAREAHTEAVKAREELECPVLVVEASHAQV